MKIALASDVHLEFGHLELNNVDNADVLVLSGDICVASKFGPNYDRFFQDASRLFKNVVYIMGNHEHYDGDFAKSESILRAALERYSNVHFLEKEIVKIEIVEEENPRVEDLKIPKELQTTHQKRKTKIKIEKPPKKSKSILEKQEIQSPPEEYFEYANLSELIKKSIISISETILMIMEVSINSRK